MNLKIALTTLSVLALSAAAQAQVTGVKLADANEMIYSVDAEACPGTFQSVSVQVTKVDATSALVSLTADLPVESCGNQKRDVTFLVPIKANLEAAGLNPATANIYFRLR